jgi:chemotaxis response regulator CheB
MRQWRVADLHIGPPESGMYHESSVAKFSAANALGVIMTGMGDDGAAGLLAQ